MLDDWLLGPRKRLTVFDGLIVIGIGLLLALLGVAFAAVRLSILQLAHPYSHARTLAVITVFAKNHRFDSSACAALNKLLQ